MRFSLGDLQSDYIKYVPPIFLKTVHASMTLQILYLKSRGVKQSETGLISQKLPY